ncbi:MAG: type IV pilus secretin PilQ [Magnetococcales bacterium]|nr:type IV pilus secretin PilQ [Magnetococcales bacterium]
MSQHRWITWAGWLGLALVSLSGCAQDGAGGPSALPHSESARQESAREEKGIILPSEGEKTLSEASAPGAVVAGQSTPGEAAKERSPSTGSDSTLPPPATRLEAISLVDQGEGIRIELKGNGPLPYQMVQQDEPPRLRISLPRVTLMPTVQPRLLSHPAVSGVFPTQESDGSSLVEVVLTRKLASEVSAHAEGLRIDVGNIAGSPGSSPAGAPPANSPGTDGAAALRGIHVDRTPPGTRLLVQGRGRLPMPQTFRLPDPPRLVLDFPGVKTEIDKPTIPIDTPEARRIVVGVGPGRVRLVVELNDASLTHQVIPEGDGLAIQLDSTRVQASPAGRNLEDLLYTQEKNDALIRLRLNTPDGEMTSHREGSTLTLDLKETSLPERLVRRLDVRDFAGPVASVDTYAEGKDLRLVVRLSEEGARHGIVQQGNEIHLRITSAQTLGKDSEPVYKGQRISMDFKGIDVQNAIKLIAEISDLNIILSDSVQGNLTMRLVNVPWDQALDLILGARGLGKVLQGNILRIAPLAEIESMAQARIQAQRSEQELEPLITEMIPVSFANAAEIRTLLMEGNQAQGTRLLSSRGSVSIDNRTNTLIVKDTASVMGKVREMIQKLDQPISQVLIEARIVEIDRTSGEALGINWGLNFKPGRSGVAKWGVADTAMNAYNTQQDATRLLNPRAGMTAAANDGTYTPSSNVNLLPAVTAGTLGFHLGSLSPLLDLDIELGALESSGKAKTISSPRVLTTNNHRASINQGINQPYATESSSGGTTYSYIQATLSLEVTPQVTSNGFVTLEVAATNNSLGTGSPPAINTKEVRTQAMVRNGETIVLGGIFQNSENEITTSVPGLGRIPILGWLFRGEESSGSQNELLIFITPRIINPL